MHFLLSNVLVVNSLRHQSVELIRQLIKTISVKVKTNWIVVLSSREKMLYRLIMCTLVLHIPDIFGSRVNVSKMFHEFKEKYHKVYFDENEEKNHFMTFANNLNDFLAINESRPEKSNIIYVLNKNADLDPVEVEKRYAIHLNTFDAVNVDNYHQMLRSDHGVDINDKNLYNLEEADKLFERYIKQEKRNITGKKEEFLHFYRRDMFRLHRAGIVGQTEWCCHLRMQSDDAVECSDAVETCHAYCDKNTFVKTLVEKNKAIYEGKESPAIGRSADILTQDQEFFY